MRAMVVLGAVVLLLAAPPGHAEDVAAKKIFVKDHATKPTKRQVLVLAADPAVQLADAGDPAANGASLHLYSATDDFCVVLPAGADWKSRKSKWTYKSRATKTSAQIKDGKLLVRVKSGVGFTLADDGAQGTVHAQVQFGTGTRFCLTCPGNKKDTATRFLGKSCAAAPCAPAPSSCAPPGVPTTTTGSVTTTTGGGTTTTAPGGGGLQGALPPTPGRFNYNLQIGLPGADAACNTSFPGSHACSYAELQAAATAGQLAGLKDTENGTVTSFWAIDASAPPLEQCVDDVPSGSNLDWEYATAHTPSRGRRVDLDNALGTLGALEAPQQCSFSNHWVGCRQ